MTFVSTTILVIEKVMIAHMLSRDMQGPQILSSPRSQINAELNCH